eukprot:PhM_4_TR10060/c1_g1_i1/m.103861/K04990/PKD2L1; polycystin 2L1
MSRDKRGNSTATLLDTTTTISPYSPRAGASSSRQISTSTLRAVLQNVAELTVETPRRQEVIPFFMLLFSLCFILLLMRTSDREAPNFYLNQGINEAFFDDYQLGTNTPLRYFTEIDSEDSMWEWMVAVFPPKFELLADEDPRSKRYFLDHASRCLGMLRIWTLRVKENECIQAVGFPETPASRLPCFRSLSDEGALADEWPGTPFVSDGNDPIQQDNSYRGIQPHYGKIFTIPRTQRSFSQYFSIHNITNSTATELKAWILDLQSKRFVDRATRVLGIEVLVYNSPAALFSMSEAYFEMPMSGGFVPTVHLNDFVFPVEAGHKRAPLERVVASLFFIVVAILLLVEVYHYVRAVVFTFVLYRDLAHLLTFWLLVNLSSIIFLTWMFVHIGEYIFIAAKIDEQDATTRADFIKLHTLYGRMSTVYNDYATMFAINILLAWLRVFRMMEHVSRLCLLTQTIRNCSGELFSVLLILLVLICGFGFMGFALYGGAVIQFNTLWSSFGVLFMFLFGEFKDVYEDMQRVHPRVTVAFFSLFFFSVWMLMLNIVLAVITESFYTTASMAKRQASTSLTTTSVINDIFNLLRDLIARRSKKFAAFKLYVRSWWHRMRQQRRSSSGAEDVEMAPRDGYHNVLTSKYVMTREERRSLKQKLFGTRAPVEVFCEEYRLTITTLQKMVYLYRFIRWLDSFNPPESLTFHDLQEQMFFHLRELGGEKHPQVFYLSRHQWALLETFWDVSQRQQADGGAALSPRDSDNNNNNNNN